MRTTTTVLLGAMVSGAAIGQNALPDRGDSTIATTRSFVFYSDSAFNLHDFLVRNARSEELLEPAPNCLAGLPEEQRAEFEHAREHYRVFAAPAGNRLLLALRYRLAGFGDFGLADSAAIEAALTELQGAAPAYQECWWAAHDARNRRWVAALDPLLETHEEALTERLSELYGGDLRGPFPVDVVSYGSFTGADSVVDPDHLLISSIEPSNAGLAALEIVFHEASHTVFGPGLDGRLWTELEAAAAADGAPLPPNFWHAMLFYTTGGVVEARLAERTIDYEQYLYTEGLFERSWPGFREPLERLWKPYVEGRAPMADAVRQVAEAQILPLPDRGDVLVAASPTFVFYSDPVTNLHDFLVWNARSEEPVEPRSECVAGLPTEQRQAFEQANDHYATTFANGAGELILLSMHWRLAQLGDIDLADPTEIAATVAALAPAMPAYETCWWREHDARNRRWIARLLPLLDANENALRARLAELYGQEVARWLPVDVVGYASVGGGSTVLNPHHVLVSSAEPADSGYSALEAAFREASYTVFSLRAPGGLWQALQQASNSATKPVPQQFSRLLLLFTTGNAVKARLAEQDVPDYELYLYRERLFEQSSPTYREAIERVWPLYLDGSVPMGVAVRQLVDALPAE